MNLSAIPALLLVSVIALATQGCVVAMGPPPGVVYGPTTTRAWAPRTTGAAVPASIFRALPAPATWTTGA